MWKNFLFWYSVYSHAYINNQAYSMNTKDWYWHCRVRTNQTSFTNRFIKSIILVNQTRARRARTNKLERGKWTRLLSVNGITSSYHLLPMHCLKHTEHGGWKSKKKIQSEIFLVWIFFWLASLAWIRNETFCWDYWSLCTIVMTYKGVSNSKRQKLWNIASTWHLSPSNLLALAPEKSLII